MCSRSTAEHRHLRHLRQQRQPLRQQRQRHRQQHRQQHAANDDRQGQVDLEHQTQRDTKQGGMGQRVAKIGHPPPDHEGAKRAGDQRQREAGELKKYRRV